MSNECLRQTYKCYSRENKCNDEDGSLKEGELMALGCNPAWQVNNVQEGFAEYLSNKSCRREYFMTCPRLPHYNFSFPFQLLQFLVRFFFLDVISNFLQMSRFTDNASAEYHHQNAFWNVCLFVMLTGAIVFPFALGIQSVCIKMKSCIQLT